MGVDSRAYSELSDDEVFEQVKCGDMVAFEEIYRRYKQRIFAYCWRIVRDRWLAEDVFQQTFLSVFEHRDQYTGGNFAAWIYTIARNWAFKARARQQRIQGHEVQEPEEGIDAIAPDTSLSPEAAADYAIVLEHIARLPVEYREALELRYLDELPYKDIAQILGISESLAKVRVFRAKKMLQKILAVRDSE